MNKGTCEGTEEEKEFVKHMNLKNDLGFWKIISLNPKTCYAIHVTKHKFGKVNSSLVKPKADVFFCEGKVEEEYLKKHNYHLDEEDIPKFKLKSINFSGVSIKHRHSEKYQILKMNPSTFKKIFGSFELGAGASIYCTKQEELKKNKEVLLGWGTDWKRFEQFFKSIPKINILKEIKENPLKRLKVAKLVKKYSNDCISKKITEDKLVSNFIFQGIGNFEEPFTAWWFYEKGELKKAGPIPFSVTTGSGRTKSDFTVVIKPKSS